LQRVIDLAPVVILAGKSGKKPRYQKTEKGKESGSIGYKIKVPPIIAKYAKTNEFVKKEFGHQLAVLFNGQNSMAIASGCNKGAT
jgi:hypothetical protein